MHDFKVSRCESPGVAVREPSSPILPKFQCGLQLSFVVRDKHSRTLLAAVLRDFEWTVNAWYFARKAVNQQRDVLRKWRSAEAGAVYNGSGQGRRFL